MKRWQVSIALLIGLSGCARATPQATPTAIVASSPVAATSAPTPAPTATASPIPSPTALPTPSPTPKPAVVYTQLTKGECCVQPFFSPDGTQVMFLDKPSAKAPTGIYGIALNAPLSEPVFFNAHPGPYNPDMTLGVDIEGGRTIIKRLSDNKKWVIPNDRRNVSFSPDSKHIIWSVTEPFGNFDVRRSDIYIANPDGTEAKILTSVYSGGFQGWLSDSNHIIVGGKARRTDPTTSFKVLSIVDGSTRDLVETERTRGVQLSPDNKWMLYMVAQAQNEKLNGMYVVSLTEPNPKAIAIEGFGAYRWCSPNKLLYIPLQTTAPSSELWMLDIVNQSRKNLIPTSPDSPFKIGNGDWIVSTLTGGLKIAYVNARDRNIWLADLGDVCK